MAAPSPDLCGDEVRGALVHFLDEVAEPVEALAVSHQCLYQLTKVVAMAVPGHALRCGVARRTSVYLLDEAEEAVVALVVPHRGPCQPRSWQQQPWSCH